MENVSTTNAPLDSVSNVPAHTKRLSAKGRSSPAPRKSSQSVKPGSTNSSPSNVVKVTRKANRRPHIDPEQKIASLMAKNPRAWSSQDVGDWLSAFGLGQYRKAFVHHAVSGSILSKLTDQVLKEELGVNSLGHREALTRAIAGLLAPWAGTASPTAERTPEADALAGGSENTSEVLGSGAAIELPGSEILKAQEKLTRLNNELAKAEARAGQRREKVEQAQRTAELAEKEVERLKTAIKETEFGVNGGKARVVKKPSKSKREADKAAAQTTFMQRLQADLKSRNTKTRSGSASNNLRRGVSKGEGEGNLATCIQFLQKTLAESNPEVAESLKKVPEEEEALQKLEKTLDDLAGRLAGEMDLPDNEVEGVKAAQGATKKAQKLCYAVRTAHFIKRYSQDLASREERLKEARQQKGAERAAAVKAGEEKDLKEAKETFAELGLTGEILDGGSGGDDLLGALLRRAKAAQVAKVAGKQVDWEAYKSDGLLSLTLAPAAGSSSTGAFGTSPAEDIAAPSAVGLAPPMASGSPALLETVKLLSLCRADELDKLEEQKGPKKVLNTYRALRAQQFLRAAREKLEAKAAKAAEVLASQRPERKVLPKEEQEAFLARLAEDAEKRVKKREELQAKALAEDRAKIPAPFVKGKKGVPSR